MNPYPYSMFAGVGALPPACLNEAAYSSAKTKAAAYNIGLGVVIGGVLGGWAGDLLEKDAKADSRPEFPLWVFAVFGAIGGGALGGVATMVAFGTLQKTTSP